MGNVCKAFDQNDNRLSSAEKVKNIFQKSIKDPDLRRVINDQTTFSLWADCKESIICEEFEQRPDTIRIPSQKDFSVGSVQQSESKHTIQERSHPLDAKAVIQVEQNFTVHFSLVIKLKLLPQLKQH